MHCMSAVYDAQISINKVSWKNRVARPQIGSNGKNAGSPVRMARVTKYEIACYLAVAPRFTPTLGSLAPRIVHLGLKLNLEEMVKLGLDS